MTINSEVTTVSAEYGDSIDLDAVYDDGGPLSAVWMSFKATELEDDFQIRLTIDQALELASVILAKADFAAGEIEG